MHIQWQPSCNNAQRSGQQKFFRNNNVCVQPLAFVYLGDAHTGYITHNEVWQSTCHCINRMMYKIEYDHIALLSSLDERSDRFCR